MGNHFGENLSALPKVQKFPGSVGCRTLWHNSQKVFSYIRMCNLVFVVVGLNFLQFRGILPKGSHTAHVHRILQSLSKTNTAKPAKQVYTNNHASKLYVIVHVHVHVHCTYSSIYTTLNLSHWKFATAKPSPSFYTHTYKTSPDLDFRMEYTYIYKL